MGYYTTIEFNLALLCDDDEFNRKWKEKCRADDDLNSWYGGVSAEGRKIVCADNYRKFYESERFADAFAPLVKGEINCRGEEGEMWRIVFDGLGNWKQEEAIIVYGESLFDAFMSEYGEEMHEELRDALIEWNKKRKIIDAV